MEAWPEIALQSPSSILASGEPSAGHDIIDKCLPAN
jgi:hypothetical protein